MASPTLTDPLADVDAENERLIAAFAEVLAEDDFQTERYRASADVRNHYWLEAVAFIYGVPRTPPPMAAAA